MLHNPIVLSGYPLNTIYGKSQDFRPDIEGLRAVAVLAILIFHLSPAHMPGGFVGVDIFFVISGYLISGQILRRSGRFSFLEFYVRRIRRLFPALAVTVAASLIAGWKLLAPADFVALAGSALASLGGFANVYFFWSVDYFNESALLHPLLHVWSLSLEEQFYLVWPVILLVSMRAGRRGVAIGIAVAAGLSLAASHVVTSREPYLAFYMMPFRIFEFAIGAAVLLLEVKVPSARSGPLSFAGAGLIGFSLVWFDGNTSWPGVHALVPAVGTALLIAGGRQGVCRGLLSIMLLRLIGRASYSIYLVHWPLIVFYRYWLVVLPTPGDLAVLFAGSLAGGALLYLLVERVFRISTVPAPTQRSRFLPAAVDRFRRASAARGAQLFAAFLVVPAAAAGFSAAVIARNGFPERIKTVRVQQAGELTFAGDLCDSSRGLCAFGDLTSQRVVYVVGDSHALNLIYGLDRLFKEQKIRGIAFYDHGCLFLWRTKRFIKGVPDEICERNVARAFEQIARDRNPVIFAGSYSFYARQIGDAQATAPFEGVGRDYAAWLADHFRSTLRFIGAESRPVIIMAQTYNAGIDIAKCVALHGRDSDKCRPTPLARAKQDAEALDAVLAGLRRDYAALAVLDPKTSFCDDSACTLSGEGAFYFRDSSHLTNEGSLFLIRKLAPQLLAAIAARP